MVILPHSGRRCYSCFVSWRELDKAEHMSRRNYWDPSCCRGELHSKILMYRHLRSSRDDGKSIVQICVQQFYEKFSPLVGQVHSSVEGKSVPMAEGNVKSVRASVNDRIICSVGPSRRDARLLRAWSVPIVPFFLDKSIPELVLEVIKYRVDIKSPTVRGTNCYLAVIKLDSFVPWAYDKQGSMSPGERGLWRLE